MSRKSKGVSPDASAPDALPSSAEIIAKATKKRKSKKANRSAKQTKADIERAEKKKEALELRRMGYTYAQIAEELNCHTTTAFTLVKEAIADIPQEAAEDLRTLELNRLDHMQQELWIDYQETKNAALIDKILALMDRRAKYLKLHVEEDTGADFLSTMAKSLAAAVAADKPVIRPDEPVPRHPIM